jgi:hypothetical protein
MPNVLFPTLSFRFVEFHCNYVIPYILSKKGGGSSSFRVHRDEEEDSEIFTGPAPGRSQPDLEDEETLLVHTETGSPLTVSQVRATWKRFVCSIDPELGGVTPMVLRASFAIYMIHSCRTGQHFSGFPEHAFLERLAAMMNTSAEMLSNVYGGCDLDDYRATANERRFCPAAGGAEAWHRGWRYSMDNPLHASIAALRDRAISRD